MRLKLCQPLDTGTDCRDRRRNPAEKFDGLDCEDAPTAFRGKAGAQFFGRNLARHIGHRKFNRKLVQVITTVGEQDCSNLFNQLIALSRVEQMKEARIQHCTEFLAQRSGFERVSYLEIQQLSKFGWQRGASCLGSGNRRFDEINAKHRMAALRQVNG